MINRRGQSTARSLGLLFVILIGVFLFILLLTWGLKAFSPTVANARPDVTNEAQNTQAIGDATGNPNLNFASYIFGRVPQYLVSNIGLAAAVVVTFVLFIMFVVSFADILAQFSLFSTPVAWVLGAGLAVIAANFNIIVLIAVWAFGLAAGLGVIATAIGIITPFVLFLTLNIGLFPIMGRYLAAMKSAKNSAETTVAAADLKAGGEAIVGLAKGIRGAERRS